jgi:class 3 adenylate cyclase/tetratricopeptide (TPR) repeat protein
VAERPGDGSRRQVTVVFTDVVGSTSLGAGLDAETLRGVMTRYYEAMREVVRRHGGAVEKFIGDAVVATFGVPDVHEDDALRAVRTAGDMHAALAELNAELEPRWGVRLGLRTGVATGEVVAGGGPAVLGGPANLAARLQGAARDGEILLAADTQRLVRDSVRLEPGATLELRGFDEPVATFRLMALDERRTRSRRPHVGREEELALLDLAYRRSVSGRRVQLVTVVGDAGIGKTRLVEEAVGRLEPEPLVLRGRCLSYGEGITYFPVGEAVATAAGIEREDDSERARAKVAALMPAGAETIVARVGEAIGLGGPAGAPEETAWAIRRFFELLAAERPLVLVFDDLHWAEPAFLDLVAQIVERPRGVAVLVVAIARTELLEQRPTWGGGAANALTASLVPLSNEDGTRLVRAIVDGGEIDDGLAERLVVTAGGNPLFLEEYVAMLLDEGTLARHAGRWEAAPGLADSGSTPPTLAGLLNARLHRLPADQREVLVHASVIGRAFSLDELRALLPGPVATRLEEVVERLLDRALIRVPTGAPESSDQLEFQHQLLRDAAYASATKATRAALHERFADRLEAGSPERPEELDEIAGFHLATAHDYRVELGTRDEATDALAERAAERLSAAGIRAVQRGDPRAAIRLLRRAISLTSDPGSRAAMRLRLCHALRDSAEGEGYEAMLEAGLADAAAADDERLRTRFEALQISHDLVRHPKSAPPQELIARLRSHVRTLQTFEDAEGVAECHYQLATIAWIGGDAVTFEGWAREALRDAVASGDARLVGRAATYVVIALLRGPTPLREALEQVRSMRNETALSTSASASVLLGEAEMLAYAGRTEEARDLVATARSELEELGLRLDLAAAESVIGAVAEAGGNLEGAERALRRSYDLFRAMNDAANGAVVAVDLAHVLARLGRDDAAQECATTAAELAADFDLEAQVGWRMASARARATLGDREAALRLIDEADRRLGDTDFTLLRADTVRVRAEVLATLGAVDEAIASLEEARSAYRAKGHVVGERGAARRLAELRARQLS